MGDKLFPFSGTIDIADLPPGEYVAHRDPPTTRPAARRASVPFTDSRTITIE